MALNQIEKVSGDLFSMRPQPLHRDDDVRHKRISTYLVTGKSLQYIIWQLEPFRARQIGAASVMGP